MVTLNEIVTKVMGYFLVAGNGCSGRCQNTIVSFRVYWLGGPCVMYYWKYMQWSMDTIPMGIVLSHPQMSLGALSSDSRKICWGLIHVKMIWSDLGMMCSGMVFSEHDFLDQGSNWQYIFILQSEMQSKVLLFHFPWTVSVVSWRVMWKFKWSWNYCSELVWVVVGVPFVRNEIDDFSFFGIDKGIDEFCFGGWGSKNHRSDVRTKNIDWFIQLSKEEKSCSLAFCFGCTKGRNIRADVEYHIRFFKLNFPLGMKELFK